MKHCNHNSQSPSRWGMIDGDIVGNMCKITVCMNTALDNGYCQDHQEFVGAVEAAEEERRSGVQNTNSWQVFLTWMAGIIFVGGVIYGVYHYNLVDQIGFAGFEPALTATKLQVLLTPILSTGSIAIILLALGKVIALLEKISNK